LPAWRQANFNQLRLANRDARSTARSGLGNYGGVGLEIFFSMPMKAARDLRVQYS
jgi:hypothetical protein